MSLTKTSDLTFGAYDPRSKLSSLQGLKYLHFFINWQGSIPTDFKNSFLEVPKDIIPVVTVEPWPKDEDVDYLKEVTSGKYDDYIQSICSLFSQKDLVIARFGHEMERKGSRYPWAGAAENDYIDAYNYFSNKCRSISAHTLYMFSPAGENGSLSYWPGEKNVDLIGLSVYSFDDWELKNIGHRQSFHDIFKPKYDMFKNFNKDIIAVEVGVTGSPEFKINWLESALKSKVDFPKLQSIIYFESEDTPYSWGKEYKTPDWNISIEDLEKLIQDK